MRDTSGVGEISRLQVMAAIARLGNQVYVPLSDIGRTDFVFEDETGRFFRVQAKTGWLRRGTVIFMACSVDSRSQAGRCIYRPYTGQIEYFGVYCPDNNKVYLVPISDTTNSACTLRIDPPRNGQKTRIRWARDYEIGEGLGVPVWVPQTVEGSETEVSIPDPSNSP